MYLALFIGLPVPAGLHAGAVREDAAQATEDPEALYRDRERPASAQAAERVWAARLAADPRDFESAWKLSRIRYWLGTKGPGDDATHKAILETGIAAGRTAAALRPDAPDGHFWMAANMGGLAEAHGLRQGIRYRGQIRDALEQARRVQPAYLDGSPDRALGRWYFKVPRLFGGDLDQSERHLRAALAYNTRSIITMLFLAETLEARGKRAEARTLLQTLLDTPPDPEWMPEDARFKVEARALLARLK